MALSENYGSVIADGLVSRLWAHAIHPLHHIMGGLLHLFVSVHIIFMNEERVSNLASRQLSFAYRPPDGLRIYLANFCRFDNRYGVFWSFNSNHLGRFTPSNL